MVKTFVLGDIHGAHKALLQCLTRAHFNYENDILICLGDVCDGWPQTKESIDELLSIKKLILILGNHDYWTLEWMQTGVPNEVWKSQGGEATMLSYRNGIPQTHYRVLEKALPYYIINNTLFVHAGIDPLQPIGRQGLDIFLWSRLLAHTALDVYSNHAHKKITTFDEVYIGHTPIPFEKPIQGGEVWLMDTGAGWSGRLSMMDIDTKEVFSSDLVESLYPGVKGRTKKTKI